MAEARAELHDSVSDAQGRIVPTLDTCRDIFQALLDHRLESRLSQRLYDVENTATVDL